MDSSEIKLEHCYTEGNGSVRRVKAFLKPRAGGDLSDVRYEVVRAKQGSPNPVGAFVVCSGKAFARWAKNEAT